MRCVVEVVAKRHLHFPGAWTASTDFQLCPDLYQYSSLSHEVIEGTKPSKKSPKKKVVVAPNMLCINSCDVEDTDLYFLLKQFPPPAHLRSRFIHEDDAIDREFKGSFYLFQHGGWDALPRRAVMAPVDVAKVSQMIAPTTLSKLQQVVCGPSEDVWIDFKSKLRSLSPTQQLPPRTSMHEHLEILIRGYTRRAKTFLYLSLDAIDTMRLPLTHNAQWYILSNCGEERDRELGSALPITTTLNTTGNHMSSSSFPRHVLTLEDLVDLNNKS